MEHLVKTMLGAAVLTNIDDDHLVYYKNIFETFLESFVMFSRENVQ